MFMSKVDTSKYPSGSKSYYAPGQSREIPHDYKAEQSLLGCLLLDNNAWDQVAGTIRKEDFYDFPHQAIFEACERIAASRKNIDLITLQSELDSADLLEKVGGQEYITALADLVPSSASVSSYASVVKDRSVKRQVLDCCRSLSDFVYENKGVTCDEILHKAENSFFEISENSLNNDSVGPRPIKDIVMETMNHIQENMKLRMNGGNGITGIPSGFHALDEKTSGFHPGEMIVLAARPSMGKTTLGMNFVENAFLDPNNHKPVVVFSLEMPAWQIVLRMLSSLSDIKLQRLSKGEQLTGEELAKLSRAVSVIKQPDRMNMLFIDDQTGLSPSDVRVRAKAISKNYGGISMILIDYLQHMSIPGYGTDKLHEVSEISRSLKQLAMELKIPVIALAQLSRNLENRPDKHPQNSDLRESGAIEQDADLIMFIYRDEYYHKDSKKKGIAEVIIGKQRNGPTGTVELIFESEYSRFSNYASNYDSPEVQPRPSDVGKYGGTPQ